MKFKQYLKEAKQYKDGNEMALEIQDAIQKIFPKSLVSAQFKSNIAPGITVFFALGKDRSEWKNGIIHNDPMHHVIHIGTGDFGKDGEVPEKMKMDAGIGGGLYVDGFEKVKIGWRNKTGTPEQIVKNLVDYFKKARKVYDENKDRVIDLVRDK